MGFSVFLRVRGWFNEFLLGASQNINILFCCEQNAAHPKNHGISSHWWFGDPQEPCIVQSQTTPFSEGPMSTKNFSYIPKMQGF